MENPKQDSYEKFEIGGSIIYRNTEIEDINVPLPSLDSSFPIDKIDDLCISNIDIYRKRISAIIDPWEIQYGDDRLSLFQSNGSTGIHYFLQSSGDLTTGIAFIEPKIGFLPPHSHEIPETYFFDKVPGRVEIILGNEIFIPQDGDFIIHKKNGVHGIYNFGEENLVMKYTFDTNDFEKVKYTF